MSSTSEIADSFLSNSYSLTRKMLVLTGKNSMRRTLVLRTDVALMDILSVIRKTKVPSLVDKICQSKKT